jgi:hypothetical protein
MQSKGSMFKRLTLVALLGAGAAGLPARAADKPADQADKKDQPTKADRAAAADKARADQAKAEEPRLAAGEAKAEAKAGAKVELPKPDAGGFIEIFNGKDLTGWEGLPDFWSVKDGAITATETKDKSKQTFLVFKGMPVSDFELHWKYKFVTKEGNSGVQFRSKLKDPKNFVVAGYQADCDAGNGFTGIIYDEAGGAGGRGIMSKRGEKTHWTADAKPKTEPLGKTDADLKAAIKPTGEWNECTLVVKGNHVVYSINGNVTTDLTDDSPKAVNEGVLALQCHAGFTMEIQFKDIKLKPLAGNAK